MMRFKNGLRHDLPQTRNCIVTIPRGSPNATALARFDGTDDEFPLRFQTTNQGDAIVVEARLVNRGECLF